MLDLEVGKIYQNDKCTFLVTGTNKILALAGASLYTTSATMRQNCQEIRKGIFLRLARNVDQDVSFIKCQIKKSNNA